MRDEGGRQKVERGRRKADAGRKTGRRLLLASCVWILTSTLLLADAPDKTRDLSKVRQEERDRAADSIPVVKPAEMYRRYVAAMKAGKFSEATASFTNESLRSMKKTLIRALREEPTDELAKFLRDAGFKSAPELQLGDPGKVVARWMRSGWRVRGYLDRLRQNEIASVEETVHDAVCDLAIEWKSSVDPTKSTRETIHCEFYNRVWRLRLEIPVETSP